MVECEFGAIQQRPQYVAVPFSTFVAWITCELPATDSQLAFRWLPAKSGQEQRSQTVVVGEKRGFQRAEQRARSGSVASARSLPLSSDSACSTPA